MTLLPASLDLYPIVLSTPIAESHCSSAAGPVDLENVSFLKVTNRISSWVNRSMGSNPSWGEISRQPQVIRCSLLDKM